MITLSIRHISENTLEYTVTGGHFLHEISLFAREEETGNFYGAGGVYPDRNGVAVWTSQYPSRDQILEFYVVDSFDGAKSNTVKVGVGEKAMPSGLIIVGILFMVAVVVAAVAFSR